MVSRHVLGSDMEKKATIGIVDDSLNSEFANEVMMQPHTNYFFILPEKNLGLLSFLFSGFLRVYFFFF